MHWTLKGTTEKQKRLVRGVRFDWVSARAHRARPGLGLVVGVGDAGGGGGSSLASGRL